MRTFLRTAAQALAPVLFGTVSGSLFGGGTSGLRWTFVIMLLPLSVAAVFLFWATRWYPSDVATAALATDRGRLKEIRFSRDACTGVEIMIAFG